MRSFLTLGGACAILLCASGAGAQSSSKLFLVGVEPPNAEMSFVEMAWLPSVTAVAPGLTGVLERDPRVPEALQACGQEQDFELLVTEAANTFGGFALRIGFEAAQNPAFEAYLACALDAVAALPPDDETFVSIQQNYYEDVDFLDYAFSLMTEFGYGLAREEFADPVPRPSELFSLTLQDYRGVWPSLLDTSDLYVTIATPTGVTDLLLAVDNQIDKTYGRPDEAVLPEQPPYTAAPLEGLGLKLQGVERTFFQVNRVFAPSIVASLSEGRVLDFIVNERLDSFRNAQGLSPAFDAFEPVLDENGAPIEDEDARAAQVEIQTPESGLWGVRPSFFADRKHIAAFTFLSLYVDPQPMASTIDALVAAIEAALSDPFTQQEFDAALADLSSDYCARAPIDGMARTQVVWLREDLFHGRADEFVSTNVLGCDGLTLERVNKVRDLTLTRSATLVYGFGGVIEDAQTRARPFCVVEDISLLEFECSNSEFQL